MTHSEIISQPAVETARQAARRSGDKRGTLALLLSIVALGLLFYPAIRHGAIMVAGPQRWLPAQLPYVSRIPANPDAKLLASSVSVFEEQLANLEASISEVRQAAAANTDAASIHALEQRLTALMDQFVALDARDATSDNAVKNQISQLDRRLADTAAPEIASLLAARLALLSVSPGLRPDDLDAITAAAAADPAMSDIVAKLKVLAEQNIPPASLLWERFSALAQSALLQATREQLGWWDSSVFAVRSTLSDLGVGGGADESKDTLVIAECLSREFLNRMNHL
ncbi:MAG: hypothetical protein WCJ41_20930 [Aestuariivirga sp.]|uniref:hypothetical protein n=1 Tax=Aestuariivirga sp. TaxID=2650926 RepID=UPI0030171360